MTTIVINGTKIDDSTSFAYKSNPKRSGSKAHARYEAYQAATNLAEYTTICEDNEISKYAKADLRYDTEKGHLSLLDADGNQLNRELMETIDEANQADTDEDAEEQDVESEDEMDDAEELEEAEIDEDEF